MTRAVVLLVALAACTDGATSDLRDARARWDRSSPASYTFTSRESCFCDPDTTRPIRIAVVGDAIDHATYADDNSAIRADIRQNLHTIDGLLDVLQDAYDDGQEVHATYAADGHPLTISIQPPDHPLDGGWSVTVTDLVPGVIVAAHCRATQLR